MEIKLEEVTYTNFKIINTSFKSNQITSVIGERSSGEINFLTNIAELIVPDSGSVVIGKHVINSSIKPKIIKLIKNNISYLIGNYTEGLFNINILEDIKYETDRLDIKKLNELLDLFDLDKSILKRNYLEISNGEKKKIMLISIFLQNREIIILDNPTTGLDSKSIDTLVRTLKRLKREDKLILISSLDLEFVLRISDRIIAIDNKKIVYDGDKYEILTKKNFLNKIHMGIPKILDFEKEVLEAKNIKLGYRDNINDLIKDIYRNVK